MAERSGAGPPPAHFNAGEPIAADTAGFEERLEHAKLEALKELAYGASHEINNPLANIAARAQTLMADEVDPERRRKLLAIHRQAMRAHEMIADLMLFARPPELIPAPCSLNDIAERVASELRDDAAERDIELHLAVRDSSVDVVADATQIAVGVKAVVMNAIEAIGAGGNVWIEIGWRNPTCDDSEQLAEIIVRDDGPGISEEVRQHIFDPFFSGREAGRGLGFGLSKCWRIVTDHGGRVVVNKAAAEGAEFSILLPVTTAHLSDLP